MKRKERGALLVEFALILPLFLFIMFGAIFGGIMLHDYNALNELTRSAARYGAVETSGNINAAEGETEASKIRNVREYINTYGNRFMVLYTVSTVSVTANDTDKIAGEPAINVKVTATRIDEIPLIVDELLPETIESSLKMRIENAE